MWCDTANKIYEHNINNRKYRRFSNLFKVHYYWWCHASAGNWIDVLLSLHRENWNKQIVLGEILVGVIKKSIILASIFLRTCFLKVIAGSQKVWSFGPTSSECCNDQESRYIEKFQCRNKKEWRWEYTYHNLKENTIKWYTYRWLYHYVRWRWDL